MTELRVMTGLFETMKDMMERKAELVHQGFCFRHSGVLRHDIM